MNAPIVGPFVPALPAVLLCLLLAGAGLGAGAAARRLLARLRRGARVPRPWCELGVAVAWGTTGAVAAVGAGSGGAALRLLPVLLGLGWLAVAASAVDVLHRRLPDALTLPALPVALLLLAPLGAAAVLRGLVAAALWAAAYGAVHLAAPAALGAGDVKLAAPLAAVLGAVSWEAVAVGAVLAAVLSVAAAAAVAVRAGGAAGLRSMALPHGPAMLLAAWLVTAAAAGARGP